MDKDISFKNLRILVYMIRRLILLLFLLVASMPAVAHTQQKSTKVVVNEMVFYLPGNWQHSFDNPEHGQHAFMDTANGLELVIVAHDVRIMKFYSDTLTNFELAKFAFIKDVDHWVDGDETEIKQTLEDTTANYLIWGLQQPEEKSVILYGAKGGKIIGLNLMKTTEEKMDKDRARVLLYKIFTSSKKQK
jgi:hypothetical protein